MEIGEKIKNLRTTKNLSMKELSKKSGISVVSICSYEKGKRQPNLVNLGKLAKALDYPFDDLYILLSR